MNPRIQERKLLKGGTYTTKGNRPARAKREADRRRGRSFYASGKIPDHRFLRLVDLYPSGLMYTINDGGGDYIQSRPKSSYGAAALVERPVGNSEGNLKSNSTK